MDRSGSISIGEFVSVPELKENPLVKRVVEIFDSDLDGEVDFKGNFSLKMCNMRTVNLFKADPNLHVIYDFFASSKE